MKMTNPLDEFHGCSIVAGELVVKGIRYGGSLPDEITLTLDGMEIVFPEGTVRSMEDAFAKGWIWPLDGHGSPVFFDRGCCCSLCLSTGKLLARPPVDSDVPTSTLGDMTTDTTVTDLLVEIDEDDDAIDELVDWLRDQTWSGFAQSLVEFYNDRGFLSPKQIASATSMRVKCEAKDKARKSKVTEDGMYLHPDGTIYKVQIAHHGTGNLYAKRLIVGDIGEKATFEFDRGAVTMLEPSMKMTLAQAQAFGSLYGVCCVCGAILTDEKSIEDGIGPVCKARLT